MIEQAIQLLAEGKDLTHGMAYASMNRIMEGEATDAQIAAFLMGLRIKGETVEEMTGGARSLAEKCIRIRPKVPFCVDPVGTGGDRTGTFNISSTAAIIASAAGACVAKHGNRSVSSRSGSADLYEALGIDIQLSPRAVESCIENTGFGFMFAPVFHPAMRHASPVRRKLGIRTLFNILGPLSNPANAGGQVLGVYERKIMPFAAHTLVNLGVSRALVVHGSDGSDEITTTGDTFVMEIEGESIQEYVVKPEDFGLARRSLFELQGGLPEDNARITMEILEGIKGAARDIVLLNAAATIYIGKAARSLAEGVEMASHAIDSGAAKAQLDRIVTYTRQAEKGGAA